MFRPYRATVLNRSSTQGDAPRLSPLRSALGWFVNAPLGRKRCVEGQGLVRGMLTFIATRTSLTTSSPVSPAAASPPLAKRGRKVVGWIASCSCEREPPRGKPVASNSQNHKISFFTRQPKKTVCCDTARGQVCPFVERNLFRFTERIEIRSTTKLPAGSLGESPGLLFTS